MRAAAASFLVCVLCCSAGGCKRYVSVPVRVEDAETGAAIKGALVESKYVMKGLKLIDFVPFGTQMRELRRSACTSDDEGMATVKLTADADTYFQGVSAKAAGYLEPYPAPVSKEVLRQLRASPRRSAEDEVKPVGRIRMLAEPPPRVVLVLPDGHRGIIRVVSRLSSMPAVPGQRIFPRAISPDEVTTIELPMLPARYDYHSPASFDARYASGRELPSRGEVLETDVALRVVDLRGDRYLLIVGTRADRDAAEAYCSPRGIPDAARWAAIWETGIIPAQELP